MSVTDKVTLYDVLFFWDNSKDDSFKEYAAETLCNILGFPAVLSVKLVIDAMAKGKTLLMTTENIEVATVLRDKLNALHLICKICPITAKGR